MTHQDDLKQHFLVDLHELLIPFIDVRGLLARIGVIIGRGKRVVTVVSAPLDNLLQHCLVDLVPQRLSQ